MESLGGAFTRLAPAAAAVKQNGACHCLQKSLGSPVEVFFEGRSKWCSGTTKTQT